MKILITGAQTMAMSHHLDERAVSILTWSDRSQQPEAIASGTCVQIAERYFLATAAHAIKGVNPEHFFIAAGNEHRMVQERSRIVGVGFVGGEDDDPLDVGWLEVDAAAARNWPRRWVPVSRLRTGVAELNDDVGFVFGYPAEKVDRLRLGAGNLHLQPHGHASYTLNGPDRPEVGSYEND